MGGRGELGEIMQPKTSLPGRRPFKGICRTGPHHYATGLGVGFPSLLSVVLPL